MEIFNKSRDDEREFQVFLEKIDSVVNVIQPYIEDIDVTDLESLRKNFILKTDDFFREDRKLNIGIIGRVKAGKSSFLNTFLFSGKDILPKAVTPKTAALTRIEYSSVNSIEVEYYTDDEWSYLKEKAASDKTTSENVVAREILEMIEERDINPYEYTKKGSESIEFESYDLLMNELNQYVGENGKYTPLVKSVTLFVNIEELKEISIVDTPGLSDPITSRTNKTKKFMEVCDVVFFLSKATGFLDNNDIELLMSQLPNKGTKKLVLVCSRFDDGLRDMIWSRESLKEAMEDAKDKLLKHAVRTFDTYRKNNYNTKYAILEQCKNPVFISSAAYNMSQKDKSEYNEHEMKIYNDLNAHGDLTNETLAEIGNINAIREIFEEVINKKDILLAAKASTFVPVARDELKTLLYHYEKVLNNRINRLKNYDREEIIAQKKNVGSKINKINASIEEIFGELYMKIEKQKANALREMRANNRSYSHLTEKEGIETHFDSCKKETSKWYLPWTWGQTTREVYTYDERYYYLDASDALDNIRDFSADASDSIENVFSKVIDVLLLKRQLYTTIIENFDTTDEHYEPAHFKLLVEQTLNAIELPVINIDVTEVIDNFAEHFSGEMRKTEDKASLKNALSQVIGELYDEISSRFTLEVNIFKEKIEGMKNKFADRLLKNFNDEFSIIIEKYTDKENEIEVYKELLEKIRIINSF
ncbi:MAG: dynamin family protein [Lachnospiraceae bacterium]|nr:dynamin family protein [Lachnospiraceae bacterium]